MAADKCFKSRLPEGYTGTTGTCPACGKSARVEWNERTVDGERRTVPFVSAHPTADGATPYRKPGATPAPAVPATRSVAPTPAPTPNVAQPVPSVDSRPVTRTRRAPKPDPVAHEWTPVTQHRVCARGPACEAWGSDNPFAVCRKCGLCWTDGDGPCAGGHKYPNAPLVPNGAEARV